MQNRKYSTIVFDLGNVLIPFDHNLWIKGFNNIEQGLGDRFYKNYINDYEVHRRYESGKISDKDFIKICLNWLENKVEQNQFLEIFSNIFTLNQNVIDLLPIIKQKYKLVLLSNTSNIHRIYGWGEYSFIEYFDELILSHEIESVKPEEKIYEAVEQYTAQPPETHIFIVKNTDRMMSLIT